MEDDEHRLFSAQWISSVWGSLSLFVKVWSCKKRKLAKQEDGAPLLNFLITSNGI